MSAEARTGMCATTASLSDCKRPKKKARRHLHCHFSMSFRFRFAPFPFLGLALLGTMSQSLCEGRRGRSDCQSPAMTDGDRVERRTRDEVVAVSGTGWRLGEKRMALLYSPPSASRSSLRSLGSIPRRSLALEQQSTRERAEGRGGEGAQLAAGGRVCGGIEASDVCRRRTHHGLRWRPDARTGHQQLSQPAGQRAVIVPCPGRPGRPVGVDLVPRRLVREPLGAPLGRRPAHDGRLDQVHGLPGPRLDEVSLRAPTSTCGLRHGVPFPVPYVVVFLPSLLCGLRPQSLPV